MPKSLVPLGKAIKARREGLLSLEEETQTLSDPFLRKGISLVVDGSVLRSGFSAFCAAAAFSSASSSSAAASWPQGRRRGRLRSRCR